MSAAALGVAVGRAEDDRTRIARAVLLLLEGLSTRQGQYLEALDHYEGELGDGDALDQVMSRLKGRSPAVLVSIGGANYESRSVNRRMYLVSYQIEMAVVSTHLSSAESRGSGGADRYAVQADPGIYKMLHDIRGRLAGRAPNVAGAGKLTPESEDIVYQGAGMAIFSARYSVAMSFKQPSFSESAPNAAESSDVTATQFA